MGTKQNLRNVIKLATPENWVQGLAWYSEAHLFCTEIHRQTSLTLGQVAGITAALSPQCSWQVNKKAAKHLAFGLDCVGYTGYKVNVSKAKRIMQGEDIERVLGKGTRYGAKVRAFYDNILNPATSDCVTIDTHAIRAAYDLVDVPVHLIRAVFESKLNLEIQSAYVAVAKEYNVRPCQLQAVAWLTVKDNL